MAHGLHTTTRGAGDTTILIVPDPPNVVEHYDALADDLARDHRVVVAEAPGFGRSKGRPRDLDGAAAQLLALLETLPTRRRVVVAPCVVAYVALRAAASRPALVDALVLLQAPSWDQETRWARRVTRGTPFMTPLVGPAVLRALRERVVRKWYEAALASAEDAPAYEAVARQALLDGARFPLASAFRRLFNAPADLAPVATPTLLVWGARDRTHARSAPESLLATTPNAEVVTFEDAGHFPDLERSVRFAAEVRAFLARRLEVERA